jgi:hypothetical protein
MRITLIRPRMAAGLAFSLLACLTPMTPAHATGDPGAWQPLLPPGQVDGATAFDAPRQRMYMFGGMGNSLVYSMPVGDGPAGWEILATSGTPPAPRSAEAFVYDSAHDCLWVFGGKGYPGGLYNLADAYGHADRTQVGPGTAPSAARAMGAC